MKKVLNGIDKPLLFVTLILFGFGLLNIVTASSQISVVRYNQALYYYFYRQLAILVVGFVGAFIILKVPTKNYKIWGYLIFIVVGFLAIAVSLYGQVLSGNKNWINILGFSFQPSEFAKPAVILALSILFERYYRKLRTKNLPHFNMIGKILFVGFFFPLIIFTQKDIGTMLVLTIIFGAMFLASPILRFEKIKTIGVMMIVLLIAFLMMMLIAGKVFSKSQMSRFDFVDPCSKYEETGYQICNGFIAINSGGIKGVGIGQSKQKSYIPEAHTDSVFAIIAEEYGFIVTSIIFVAFVYVLYRILKIGTISNTIRGRYICIGVATYIFLHILINLGGLFALMPLTGIPLPFLSYGGSFTLSLILSLALVQRISIETKNQRIKI